VGLKPQPTPNQPPTNKLSPETSPIRSITLSPEFFWETIHETNVPWRMMVGEMKVAFYRGF
jgi:hypothetical protein